MVKGTVGNNLWEELGNNLWKMPASVNRLGTVRDSRLWGVRGNLHQKLDSPEPIDYQRSLFQREMILKNSRPMKLPMRILTGQIWCLSIEIHRSQNYKKSITSGRFLKLAKSNQ